MGHPLPECLHHCHRLAATGNGLLASEGRHLGSVDQNEEVVESELKYAYALSGIAAGCPEH